MGQRLNLGNFQPGQRLMPQMQGPGAGGPFQPTMTGVDQITPGAGVGGMGPTAMPGGPMSQLPALGGVTGNVPGVAPMTGGIDPMMQMPNARMPMPGNSDPLGGGRPPYGQPQIETPPMPLGQQRGQINPQMLAQALTLRRGPTYG